jgi:hypothetical protein
VRAVQQHHGAGARVLENGKSLEKIELMATDEVCASYQVGARDVVPAEAKMRRGDRAGFLGVVDEVSLSLEVGFVANDLRRVLARTDGAVGTETVEDCFVAILGGDLEVFANVEGLARDVVDDA